ncbi:MAG TPA: peptidylprolyl isomerase [Gemmataceae bacterium]|nr:peptidylprolyl isomerase [Gemmataceae bacterium]
MLTDRTWLAALTVALLGGAAFAQERVATPPTPATTASATLPKPPTGVAATVNGQPILEVAVQRGLKRVPPDKHDIARPEILDYLIDNLLIEQYLLQLKIEVDKKEVDAQVEQMRADIKRHGQTFENILKELMLTEEELRGHIAADLRWNKYAESQAAEKALRELFEANRDMFNGAMVHARHILVTPASNDPQAGEQAKAQLLLLKNQIDKQVADGLAKLPPGQDNLAREQARAKLIDDAFAAAAREKSSCPSKEKGGDVGWFPRAGSMVEPFAKAAFDLKPYQMSDVVKTQFGYHLILVLERRPGREVKFEEVKDDVKEVYCDRLRESLCARLRQTAKIVINPAPKP